MKSVKYQYGENAVALLVIFLMFVKLESAYIIKNAVTLFVEIVMFVKLASAYIGINAVTLFVELRNVV
jgi:hypothetical protein